MGIWVNRINYADDILHETRRCVLDLYEFLWDCDRGLCVSFALSFRVSHHAA